ncbi:50S ribosomal protein L2 [Archaeoglobus veneficus]|uniref:Large ribosomal subunit protein uL2 n=1 Tax=Archaeoglobus veneficus (strain DSM 11195 / SNP6) TaxID=693661 RepID=F2KSU8_ARCVS|nr:50S ribosomal protein L2 [Archaeoglobus veneficus]AEA46993.1 Ribosomal protein L2, C-terminal protein [Archaeoglobus veneficus SNP6]
MGKRIIAQNRGKGTPTYTAPSHKYKADLRHLKFSDTSVVAKVIDIEHDPARNAPIALVKLPDGGEEYIIATEGMGIGDVVEAGPDVGLRPGNITFLKNIPEGTPICNVESQPGDGGKFARSSGTFALVVAHEEDRVLVQMPSGQLKWFNPYCRAMIGVVAGGGRTDKPFVKAGKKYYKMKSKAAKWPRVRGVAMNAVDHPFGGGKHQHVGKPKTVSRNAPPGRKVGSIAARRTGVRR